MNEVVAAFPGKEIHVILDNLNTHKPSDDRWLKRRKDAIALVWIDAFNPVEAFDFGRRQPLRGPAALRASIAAFSCASAAFRSWR